MVNEFGEIILSNEEELKELDQLLINKIKNVGFVRFFREFIDCVKKLEFYCIKFFPERDVIYEAFFAELGGINLLSLPKKFVLNELTNMDLAIILHEVSHFKHLTLSNGMYMSPNIPDESGVDYKKLQDKFNVEYEAYYRSMYYNSIYEMNIRNEIIEANKLNLLHVLNMNGLTTRHYDEKEREIILKNVNPKDLIYTGKRIDLDNKLTNKEKSNE
jgi:hypothetical protein